MLRTNFKSPYWILVVGLGLTIWIGTRSDARSQNVTNVLTEACEKFRRLDVAHADFYDDMVAVYSGPDVANLLRPYGIGQADFKFAYEIGALSHWRLSHPPDKTAYGEQPMSEREARLWYESILNYELPGSVEGSEYRLPTAK